MPSDGRELYHLALDGKLMAVSRQWLYSTLHSPFSEGNSQERIVTMSHRLGDFCSRSRKQLCSSSDRRRDELDSRPRKET